MAKAKKNKTKKKKQSTNQPANQTPSPPQKKQNKKNCKQKQNPILFLPYSRENILKTAKALVEDTKTLVAGAASNQEQLAAAAQAAVKTITRLADVVKTGAGSLGAEQPEAQVGVVCLYCVIVLCFVGWVCIECVLIVSVWWCLCVCVCVFVGVVLFLFPDCFHVLFTFTRVSICLSVIVYLCVYVCL